jgi:starch-binding outer membrane protein, SusD/RagB family
VPVANYVDAQLILAESQLAANDAGWLATLNALRAGPTNIGAITVTGMAPLTDPGNASARLDLLFRERAFWTFGRGQRLGDLRREIRVYNKTAAQVFPGEGGINPRKNSNYGPDVNLPVPQAERNNFKFGGCTDRKA